MKKINKKSIPNTITIIRMIFAMLTILSQYLFIYISNARTDSLFNKDVYSYSFFNIKLRIPIAYIITGSIFIIASITDWLDGYLARKYKWISTFGKLWDPIADKLLVDGLLICLSVYHSIPMFIPITMISRDIVVDAMRMYASSKGIIVAANAWGKLKTVTQMIAIIATFFAFGIPDPALDPINNAQYILKNIHVFLAIDGMYLLACLFSITSGIIYVVNINKKIRKENAKKN